MYMFCVVTVLRVHVFYCDGGKSEHVLYCDSGKSVHVLYCDSGKSVHVLYCDSVTYTCFVL